MLFGVPYMGSKTKIANNILRQLPAGERFIDLFGGGFAMSHAALLSGKYKKVVYSDYNPLIVDLVERALNGDFNYKRFRPEFVTREMFNEFKDKDSYIKYIWSFGNNGNGYLFSKQIEHLKHIAHDFVVFGKYDPELEKICKGATKAVNSSNISTRRKQFCGYCKKNKNRFDLEQLERLERLQQLERLGWLGQINVFCRSYQDYDFQKGDVVYCDPPYEGTAEYDSPFNFKLFYEWAASRDYQIFFSNYNNISDERFKLIWAKKHSSSFSATNNNTIKYECLYTNKG